MKSFLPDSFCSSRAGKTTRFRNVAWLALTAAILAWSDAATRAETVPDKLLKVVTREEDGRTHFYVQNLQCGNVTATLDAQLLNMSSSTNLPLTVTVPGKQTVEIFTLSPLRQHAPWNFNYTFACNLGSVAAAHDEAQVYELPYEPGTAHRVVQGHHGSFSHTGPDEYAIDWKMPEGTPVCAARGGLVVKARDNSTQGGPDRKFETLANGILVQHVDGTIGVYLHLQKGGNKVKVGDQVKAGDVIGLSGNTGFSSGPHLHFAVYKLVSGSERVTIPVKFRTADSEAVIPVTGRAYMAALQPQPPVAAAGPRMTRSGS
jgi:murein DD-endopeptidase MepM/ murein hydrolase activator NlpD